MQKGGVYMKISTQIEKGSLYVGEEKTVELIAKAGFDAWDFSMFSMCDYDWENQCLRENSHPLAGANYLAFARKLKKVGLDNGIVCNQSHAPFPARCKPIRDHFKRACKDEPRVCIICLAFVLRPFISACPISRQATRKGSFTASICALKSS